MRLGVLGCVSLLFLLYLPVQAQSLQGHVQSETTHQPIESVYVTLNQLSDSLIVAFDRTDAAGAFALTFQPEAGQAYYLAVSHVSYQRTLLPLPTNDAWHNPFTINMQLGSLVLNEVQVTARVAVREQGDSTHYRVDAFRNGSEQTLEEVLRKMPNIRVDDNGTIFFKNKRIDKVMLDGDDLVGNAYQLATRSINPSLLNEVQAIENFSENKLLRQIEQSDKTVLNLTVKSERKALLFGLIDVVGGPQRYNALGNLFSYQRKFKAFSVLSVNNVGTHRLDLTEAGASVLPDDRPPNDPTIRPFAQIAQPFSYPLNSPLENLNTERIATFNLTLTPVKSLKITANLTGLQDQVQAGRTQNYQALGDLPFSYQQADTLSQRPALGHLRVQAVYDWSATTALIYKGILGQKTISLTQNTWFLQASKRQWIPQQFDNQLHDGQHLLEFTHKYSPVHAVQASVQLTNTRFTEHQQTPLNIGLSAALFQHPSTDFDQFISQQNQLFSGQVKWLYGTKKRKFEQQIGYNSSDFSIHLQQNTDARPAVADSLTIHNQTFFARSSFRLTGHNVDLTGYARFEHRAATIGLTPYERSVWQGNLAVTWRLNPLNSLSLSYERQIIPIANAYMLNRYVATDYRSAQRGLSGFLFDASHQVALSYFFTDIVLRKMTLVATAFTSQSSSLWSLSDYELLSDYSLSRLLNTPQAITGGFTLLMDKLIYPLSGNLRVDARLLRIEKPQFVNGESRTAVSYLPTITAKYISVFDIPFNMEIGGTYRYTSQTVRQVDSQTNQSFATASLLGQFFYRAKAYQINAVAENYWLQQNHYFFLKANATYQVNPKLTLRFEAANLLNQTSFQQISLSPTFRTVGEYSLLGRIVMLGGRFNF